MAYLDASTIGLADYAQLLSSRQRMSLEYEINLSAVSEWTRVVPNLAARRKFAEEKIAEAKAALEKMTEQLAELTEQEERALGYLDVANEGTKNLHAAIGLLDAEVHQRDMLCDKNRSLALLEKALPLNTPLRMTSNNVTWNLVFIKDGLKFNDTTFKSPSAVSKAHASMIHEGHLAATKAGNGWKYLKVTTGRHAGKTIASVYDAYFKR